MLRDMRELIRERGSMTLRELALHFDMDADATEGMLSILVEKGQITRKDVASDDTPSTCKGCLADCEKAPGRYIVYRPVSS